MTDEKHLYFDNRLSGHVGMDRCGGRAGTDEATRTDAVGRNQGPQDLEYVEGGHERNRLDLYLPEKAEDRLPLIVWIHGGAWYAGSKEGCPAVPFAAKGYAVASINYRLSQHAIFPAQIEDCKAAIRWLRANAAKYNLDPDHIGVWGASAGGHLVALLGTTAGVKELEGQGGNLDQSSRVQCVVDWFGPTDLTTMGDEGDKPGSPVALLIGGPVPGEQGEGPEGQPADLCQQGRRPLPHHARRQRQPRAAAAERVAGRGAEEGRRGGHAPSRQGQRARRAGIQYARKPEADRGRSSPNTCASSEIFARLMPLIGFNAS